jgi:hypothetical protein
MGAGRLYRVVALGALLPLAVVATAASGQTSVPHQAPASTGTQKQTGDHASSSRTDEQKPPAKARSMQPAPDSAAQDNPFPMAQSEAAAQSESPPSNSQGAAGKASSPAPTTAPSGGTHETAPPAKPAQSTTNPASPAGANPFPMAKSEAAAKQKQENQSGGAFTPNAQANPGSYSSSNTDMSPTQLGQGSVAPMPGRMDTFARDHTLDGRIEDDLKVADLYMKNGNYRGAQWRYQDALHYDPTNDTALYGVAEALCKRNETQAAMAHFRLYLKNNPNGKQVKKAKEMLKHPNECEHNR